MIKAGKGKATVGHGKFVEPLNTVGSGAEKGQLVFDFAVRYVVTGGIGDARTPSFAEG
jgi:hypothetical protein